MDVGKPGREAGFTLIELAIAIVVIGLLLAGLLGPMSVRVEQQERAKTQALLDEIKEALLGYAAINGFLPCPTIQGDPANGGYGVAAPPPCPVGVTDGILPWKTLGVSPTDAWGRPRTAPGDPWRGYWRYRVDGAFVGPALITMTTTTVDLLEVEDGAGNKLTIPTEPPIAIVFSAGGQDRDNVGGDPDGDNTTYDGTYEAGSYSPTFDDMTTWLSRPLLFNRMLMAGKLP
ncbi:MAG: type II secretion system protein [Gammaproteobacteria bacterium]